jgi:hypothetical protein
MATMVPGTTVAPPVLAVQIVVVLVMLVLHGLVPLAVVATTGVTTIQVAVQSLMLAFDGAMIAAMRARQSSMQLRMSVAKPVVAVETRTDPPMRTRCADAGWALNALTTNSATTLTNVLLMLASSRWW